MSQIKKDYGRESPSDSIMKNQSEPLIFQVVDLDYVQGTIIFFNILHIFIILADNGVRIRMFGSTRKGNSICLSAYTYVPYFFVKAPKSYTDSSQLAQYKESLNGKLTSVGTIRDYH